MGLFVEVPYAVRSPAVLAARMARPVSRMMGGRKVDVVLAALNLNLASLPTHDVARREKKVL